MAGLGKRSPKTPENTSREPFVPFGFEPVPSLDENSECPSAKLGKHKEMWLIKVPAEFDASSLSGKTVVLDGSQDLQLKLKDTKARFEVISKPISNSVPGSCKVLLPYSHDEPLWAANTFDGNMSVIQSVSIPTPDSPPPSDHSSHHVQAPDITCRWKPFGYEKPFSSLQQTKKAKKKHANKSQEDHKTAFGFNQKKKTSEIHHKQEAERKDKKKKEKEKIKIKQEKSDKEEHSPVKSKQEAERKDKKKKEKEKIKIKQEKSGKEEHSPAKSKKIKTEKTSPENKVRVKIEKLSPKKEKSREEKEKEKKSLSFIPPDVNVKTERPSEEEGETPKKKRKKEKRK